MNLLRAVTGTSLGLALLALPAAPGAALAAQQRDSTATVALSLGEAARAGAARSALAVGAHYRADEFAARAREVRAALLPSVSGTIADGKRTFNSASFGIPLPGFDPNGEILGPVRTVDFRGRLSASLFDLASLGRYRSAQAAAAGAGADADAAGEQAGATAATAYVRVLRAAARVDARSADSAIAGDLLRIARQQLDAGVGVRLEVTRAEAQLAGVRAQLIAARNERDRARLELLRAVGLPVTTPMVLTDSLAGVVATDTLTSVEAALDAARRTRPDLRAALAAVRTAQQSVGAARAERLPTLGVFADAGATSNGYDHLLGTYTWGVQLSVPVFEGFRIGARVGQQTALLHQAETRERDLEAQVEVELRTALLDLASAREQVDAAGDRLRLGEDELAQARDRFQAGVAGNADVITAQTSLNTARDQYVEALAALQLGRVALARAAGRVTALP